MSHPALRSLALCLALPAALACRAKAQSSGAAAPAPAPAPVAQAAPAPAPAAGPRVKLDTNYGAIVIELAPQAAPRTVENFLQYVKERFYAGTIFHRVIPGFMIQGGGLKEDLSEKEAHLPIPNEAARALKAGMKNLRGTVAMARTSDPDSASSQFFINVADNAALDWPNGDGYGYCVFGRVVEGMEVVDKIAGVRTEWRKGNGDVPQYAVRIKGAELMAAPAAPAK